MRPEETLLAWVPRLRRYARALVSQREDADDLVQDTLERAWAKSGQWGQVSDMRAWLFSVMHNVHIDALRRKRISTVPMDDEAFEVPAAPLHNERLDVLSLQAALGQLPLAQKEVLLLVALEGLSYAEVAKALMIPEGTVMSRLSRGRERLRVLMEGSARPLPAVNSTQHLKVVK